MAGPSELADAIMPLVFVPMNKENPPPLFGRPVHNLPCSF